MKRFRKVSQAAFGGALALQGTKVLQNPTSTQNLTDAAAGFVGIGVAGITADMAFKLAGGKYVRRRHKRR